MKRRSGVWYGVDTIEAAQRKAVGFVFSLLPTLFIPSSAGWAGVFRAAVPSGASTGIHEALELRDGVRGVAWRGVGVQGWVGWG